MAVTSTAIEQEQLAQPLIIFNPQNMLQKWCEEYELTKKFCMQIAKDLRWLVRVHGVMPAVLEEIFQALIATTTEQSVKIILSQVLKYAIQHQIIVEQIKIVNLLKICDDSEVRTQLLFALGYSLQLESNQQSQVWLAEFNVWLTTVELPEYAIDFFQEKCRQQQLLSPCDGQIQFQSRLGFKASQVPKLPTIATRTQQTHSTVAIRRQSEAGEIILQDITLALKSRNKINVVRSIVPPEADQSAVGSNQYFLYGTYTEVRLRYAEALNSLLIKDDDKDKYLPARFLNKEVKWFCGGIIGVLLTDRMIAATFAIIAEKQRLTAETIKKLLQCLKDRQQLQAEIIGKLTITMIMNSWLPTETEANQLELPLVREIREIKELLRGSYNESEIFEKVQSIIDREIAALQLDAITAIFALVKRDNNVLDRLPQALITIGNCLTIETAKLELKEQAIKILNYFSMDNIQEMKKYLNKCIVDLKSFSDPSAAINFILQQVKNPKICKEIDESIIKELLDVLAKRELTDELKINCCKIITAFLMTRNISLTAEQLERLVDIIKYCPKDDLLKHEVLTAILWSAKLTTSLPFAIVQYLLKSFEVFDDYSRNLIIITLGVVFKNHPIKVEGFDSLVCKLCDYRVIISEDSNISFEEKNAENKNCLALSAIVGQILVVALQQEGARFIKENSLIQLGLPLECNDDKTTKILSAKALAISVENHQFPNELLVRLKEHVSSPIADVAIYTSYAYVRGLEQLSVKSELISKDHLEILAKLFNLEPLFLGEENFAEKINNSILTTLKNEAKKSQQIFDINICKIFEYLLLTASDYQKIVIEILLEYTKQQNKIPDATIIAVEDALDVPELTQMAESILFNLIKNKCSVNDKTLKLLIDRIYLATDPQQRAEAVQLLELADNNQDLPEVSFSVLALERAGLAITIGKEEELIASLKYLQQTTNAGKKLSPNIFAALAIALPRQEVLTILINAVENRQIIPSDLLDKLITNFTVAKNKDIFLSLFLKLASVHQTLPQKLKEKLILAMECSELSSQILLIFAIQAQHGEILPAQIIEKINLDLKETPNLELKYEYFQAMVAIYLQQLRANSSDLQKVAVSSKNFQALCHFGLETTEPRLMANSIAAFMSFVQQGGKLEVKSVDLLLEFAGGANCKFILKQQIIQLLQILSQQNSLTEAQIIKLFILQSSSQQIQTLAEARQLLFSLNQYITKAELLPQNFVQLGYILDNFLLCQKDVISLLDKCQNLALLPKAVIESIITIFCSTLDVELQRSCKIILKKIKSSDQSLTKRLTKLFVEETAQLSESRTTNPQEILIEKLQREIRERNLTIETLSAYLAIIKTSLTKQLVQNIKLTNAVIQIFDNLSDLLIGKEQSQEVNLAILKCLASSPIVIPPTDKILKILTKALTGEIAYIRGIAFHGFNIMATQYPQIARYQSAVTYFYEWCKEQFRKINVCFSTEIPADLALLEIIISIKSMNKNSFTCINPLKISGKVFTKLDPMTIGRNLLLVNLLETATVEQQQLFYDNWEKVEQSINDKQQIVTLLKLLYAKQINNYTFMHLYEITKFLLIVPYEISSVILEANEQGYLSLKQILLENLLKTKLQVTDKYLKKLVAKLIEFTPDCLAQLFLILSSPIENLSAFNELIKFMLTKQVDLTAIALQSVTPEILHRTLAVDFLVKKITTSEINLLQLAQVLTNLLEKNWQFAQLEEIFSKLPKENRNVAEMQLLQSLELLVQYNITENEYQNLLLSISDWNKPDLLPELQQMIIKKIFPELGKIKIEDDLIRELQQLNPEELHLVESAPRVLEQLKLIKTEAISTCLSQLSNKQPIKKWSLEMITQWAKAVRNNSDCWQQSNFIIEALAIAKRAIFLIAEFQLTDVQILSCLLLITANQDKSKSQSMFKGKLLQVATGEGKSTIISICAVIAALSGEKVDIITSSPVLAMRDAKEKAKLYQLFTLSCGHNVDRAVYLTGVKDCYKCDIVYGEVAQFQFDILRDQYSLLGTMAGRQSTLAIVDEVDSMLIDDSSKIARLSSTIAGMDQLQSMYYFLWQRLTAIQVEEPKLMVINETIYYLYKIILNVTMEPIVGYIDIAGNLKSAAEIEALVISDIETIGHRQDEDPLEFIQKHLLAYGQTMLKSLQVPKHLMKFVETQLPKWVKNALIAKFFYHINEQYVVQDGSIKPVDHSTGVIQSSTNWGDGLHQFLQIKERLKITSETFTTNFLSNIGFFQQYGVNLIGLTGTVGSIKSRQIFKEIYQLNSLIVPSFRQKQYLTFPAVIAQDETQWLTAVCNSALTEIAKNRGVLIIAATIEQAQIIAQRLKVKTSLVRLYIMNDVGQEHAVEQIKQKEIIVATNLAGRGTDIKTADIEEYGGMHVIVTFLPENQRIEEQAFGRTARQGKRGTGQIILNARLEQISEVTIENLYKVRDVAEAQALTYFQQTELISITIKDQLFFEFCKLLVKIRNKIRQKYKADPIGLAYENGILSSIEEQWAMFLREIEINRIDNEIVAKQKYQEFKAKIWQAYKEDVQQENWTQVIKNPWQHTMIAYTLLQQNSTMRSTVAKAMQHFDQAIAIDPDCAISAYLGKAWLLINGKHRLLGNAHEIGYKSQVIEALENCSHLLTDEIALLMAIQTNLVAQGIECTSALSKQFVQKISLLSTYLNSVQGIIATTQASRRLIDFKVVQQDSKMCLYSKLEQSEAQEKLNLEVLKNAKQITMTFHDLTARKDCVTYDQAEQTIMKSHIFHSLWASLTALPGSSKESVYISIDLEQLSLKYIQTMLIPDIIMKNLTKAEALQQLSQQGIYGKLLTAEVQVTLEFVVNNNSETHANITIAMARELIERLSVEQVSITLQKTNKIGQCFVDKMQSSVSVNLEFSDLTKQKAIARLQELSAETLTLTITGTKTTVLMDLEKLSADRKVQIYDPETKLYQTVTCLEAKTLIQAQAIELTTISLPDISQVQAKNLMPLFQDEEFKLTFMQVNLKFIREDLEDAIVNISFTKLNDKNAVIWLKQCREEHLAFNLVFHNLSFKQAEQVLRNAVVEQEDLEITKIKTLSSLFTNDLKPNLELQELTARCIEYLLEVNEKRFIPYRSLLLLNSIAAVQIGVGAVLVGTGFGAQFGMGLMTEGVADLVYACYVLKTRNFSVTDYVQQKAISTTISLTCMGFQALKDVAKGARTLLGAATEEIMEQGITQVIKQSGENSLTLGQIFMKARVNLGDLARKQAGVLISEAATRGVINLGIEKLTNFCFDRIKPQLMMAIEQRVKAEFLQSTIIGLVANKLLVLDKINHVESTQGKILQIVTATLNPEHSYWRKKWDSIGVPLCRGILSDQKYLGSHFSLALRIYGVITGSYQVTSMLKDIHEALVIKFKQIDTNLLTISKLLFSQCGVNSSDIAAVMGLLKTQGVVDEQEQLRQDLTLEILQAVDFGKFAKYQAQVVEFLLSWQQKLMQYNLESLSQIIKAVTELLIEQIFHIMEAQLILPWTTYGTGILVNTVSRRVQNILIDQRQLGIEQKLAADMATTFEEQIYANAKDFTVTYSQMEMSYYSSIRRQQITMLPANAEVIKHAREIAQEQPAILIDLVALIDHYKIKVIITDDLNYRLTAEQIAQNFNVIYYDSGLLDLEGKMQIGHFKLLDARGVSIDVVSQGHDCGYAVLSKLIGKQPKELRQKLVQLILNNPNGFARALKARDWIVSHYPREANVMLFCGGHQRASVTSASSAMASLSKVRVNEELKVSEEVVNLIRGFEGSGKPRLKAYRCPAGILTIGYGHTGEDVKENMVISAQRAEQLLQQDIYNKAVKPIFLYVKVKLNQQQFDALVSWTFNLGSRNLQESRWLKELNKGNYDIVPKEMRKYNGVVKTKLDTKSGEERKVKEVLRGLNRRRKIEAELFASGTTKMQVAKHKIC